MAEEQIMTEEMDEAAPGAQDVVAFLRGREMLYAFFGEVFRREATVDLLDNLASTPLPKLDDDSMEARGYDELRHFLVHRDGDTLRALRAEYARIFLGAGAIKIEQMASPYESVYTSEEALLMQDARDSVLRLFHREGYDVVNPSNEPEDHIANELDFVSLMCGRAACAIEAGNEAEGVRCIQSVRQMYEEHLSVWVPAFCSDTVRLAKTGFYRSIARILMSQTMVDPMFMADCELVFNADAKPAPEVEAVCDTMGNLDFEAADTQRVEPSDEEKRAAANKLFEHMGFMRGVFSKTLKYCLEPRTGQQLEDFLVDAMKFIKSAYGPAEVRYMLKEAWCLEHADLEEEDLVELGLMDVEAQEASETEVAPEETGLLSADEQAAMEAVKPVVWQTTSLGQEYIEDEKNALDRIAELFKTDADLLEGYQQTLSVLKDGTGSFAEVEEVIKQLDLYQVDNKHASMFLKRLEDAGAIEWQNRWVMTSAGEKTLADLLAQAV